MQDKSHKLLNSIRFAIFDELKHQKLNRHEALLAVLDLVDNPENIYKRANDLGLVKNERIIIGGVKFNLI